MKKQNLYNNPIKISKNLYLKLDELNDEDLLIVQDDVIIERFSLLRKTYTLFKRLQCLTNAKDYYTIEGNKGTIYGQKIHLKNGIYMQVSGEYACLTLNFYQKQRGQKDKLLYFTTLTYTTKDMLKKMLVPYHMLTYEDYYKRDIFKFVDMLVLQNYQQA